jgi:Cu2+-exporting ATPase
MTPGVMAYMDEFYFESAAMILALITVGKMLEAKSKGRTTDALKSLINLAPKTAVVVKNGDETEIPVEQVRGGDVFVVRPGESIPVDGVVLEGRAPSTKPPSQERAFPADKAPGDQVSAATINQSGFLRCRADPRGAGYHALPDNPYGQRRRRHKGAHRQGRRTEVSGVFVPVVMGIAAVTTLVWLFVGQTFAYALARGISVLVISCPCALGLATPVAIMVGSGMGAKNGVLFKTAASLESAGKADIVVLDKTGTITAGEPIGHGRHTGGRH